MGRMSTSYFVSVFRGDILKMFHVSKVICHIKFHEPILISALWLPCRYFTAWNIEGRVLKIPGILNRIENAGFSAAI